MQKRFLEYVDVWGIVNGESVVDSFITGFSIGAKFAYDTLASEHAPFEDLLNEKQKIPAPRVLGSGYHLYNHPLSKYETPMLSFT